MFLRLLLRYPLILLSIRHNFKYEPSSKQTQSQDVGRGETWESLGEADSWDGVQCEDGHKA